MNTKKTKKRIKVPQSRVKHVLQVTEQKLARQQKDEDVEMPRSLNEIYEAMQHETVQAATDWIVSFGPMMRILYGCVSSSCRQYPLRSCDWWRVAKDDTKPGQSHTGGYWRCGNCCERYSNGVGFEQRLLVIGEGAVGDEKSEYFMSFIGETTPKQEGRLNFLRGLQMLRKLGDKQVTPQNLLSVISEINQESHQRLGHLAETRTVFSRDPRVVVNDSIRIYCESEALSLNRAGVRYKVIDMSMFAGSKNMVQITPDELDFLLDSAIAFSDVEQYVPKGPAEKSIKAEVMQSPAFLNARLKLVNTLSKM
jgi:hypothetical protein